MRPRPPRSTRTDTLLPYATLFRADGPPAAIILALHGFNDYSRSFEAPAAYWADRGIATYAYDQRGFGQTPHRGLWPGAARLIADRSEEDTSELQSLMRIS